MTSLSRPSVTNELIQNAVVSNEYSKKYISKLILTAIGFILHQRTDLDRRDFAKFIHNGLVYHSFKKRVQNSDVREMREWIVGVIDAFKRNYLKEFYLIFADMFDTEIRESYKFGFTYQEDNVALDKLLVEQNLRKATDKILRSISKLKMEKLKNIEFSPYICLTYNDNVPPDYEPPYCYNDPNKQDTTIKLEHFLQLGKHLTILGCVDTSFHLVQTDCQLDESDLSNLDAPGTTSESVNSVVGVIKSENLEDTHEASKRNIAAEDLSIFSRKMDCSCSIKEKFINIEVVECSKCLSLKHISCLGFLYSHNICDPYICQKCKNTCSTPVTVKQQFTCAFRLVLAFIFFNRYFPYIIIHRLSKMFAEEIIIRLKNMKVICYIDEMYLVKNDINTVIEAHFCEESSD